MCLLMHRRGLRVLILPLLFFMAVADAEVSFTPSPAIGVNEVAIYQCSVNDSNIDIYWYADITLIPNSTLYANFTVVNETTNSPELIVLGLPEYNNTLVTCLTSEGHRRDSTLRLQGQLAAVTMLSCHITDYCIQCLWGPPFSLIPIPSYIVNITTSSGELVATNATHNTSWIYCPAHYGNYTISVAGNNTAGQGQVKSDGLNFIPTENTITDFAISYQIDSNGSWNMTCILKNVTRFDPNPEHISAELIEVGNNQRNLTKTDTGYGEYQGNDLYQNINLGKLPNNTKWKLKFSFVYESFSISTQTTDFSTFDVVNVTAVVNESTEQVCFTCQFVIGSSSRGCFVIYKSLGFNGRINISRDDLMSANSTGCVTGVHNSTYNVTAYDIDDLDNPAVELLEQYISGILPEDTILPFPTSTVSLPLVSPTEDVVNATGAVKVWIIAVSVVVGVAITVAILVLPVVIAVIRCRMQRSSAV